LPLATDDAVQGSPYFSFHFFISPFLFQHRTNYVHRLRILVATISENMTLSTSPTFICKDVSSTPFALTLRIPAASITEGVRGGGYDVRGFKKGFTVVVPGATRSGVKEGKQGFVEVAVGSVKVRGILGKGES
jgi:hypothetical protein